MATRKKAKSLNQIYDQWERIRERSGANSQRARQAQRIATQYIRNIVRTPTHVKGEGNIERSLNRKYVDYNTDKAKAASNG